MADLVISQVAPGVARASSVDPFDSLVVHRIDRAMWRYTPDEPGIYLLCGSKPYGELTVYVGMSRTGMVARIQHHRGDPTKDWFEVVFAVPIGSPVWCPVIEAELIAAMTKAGVVELIANEAPERLYTATSDVHVGPAVDKIRAALQLLLGRDIFALARTEPTLEKHEFVRMVPLAREYREAAAKPRPRSQDDPEGATHAFVKRVVCAWGRFEADDPDKRFRVLAGSMWRSPALRTQVGLSAAQDELVAQRVLSDAAHVFAGDYVFDNWTQATRVVSGMSQYSGAYNWQRLIG
jgi:hypothetical protein